MRKPAVIELAWPDKRLSPNARVHHMQLHSAKKKAKDAAFWSTRTVTHRWSEGGRIKVRMTFHPPEIKRDRDIDNCIASMKAALDGIALALDVNDSQFDLSAEWGEPVPNGRVLVEVAA